jgi:2,4-dienoyl-CoA reductase (NADPH2)
LRLLERKNDIAKDLLQLIKKEKFDAIIMGRRGISGIKRWLLGSVSAALLRNVTDETLFLID